MRLMINTPKREIGVKETLISHKKLYHAVPWYIPWYTMVYYGKCGTYHGTFVCTMVTCGMYHGTPLYVPWYYLRYHGMTTSTMVYHTMYHGII